MYIFEYAQEHGFKKFKPEFTLVETDTIRVKEMITLDQVSEATGAPIEELQFLNPSYKLDIIPYIKGKNYVLRLPRNLVGTFVNNEDQIYAFAKDEFEKRETPESRFAHALDRFQPFLHNYFTEGQSWQENEIESRQVESRMRPVNDGAPNLWNYVNTLIEDAVEKGFLAKSNGG